MQLIFLYGPAAAGKLTIGRELAARTGLPLFHNHLIVDAVAAVFPFGSEPFARLREEFWLKVFAEAASANRSLIFTFAPEASVAADFPQRVQALVSANGGETIFVALTIPHAEQERRLTAESRTAFGKLRDVALLRSLQPQFDACMRAMPEPVLTLDTSALTAKESAERIAERIRV